MIAEVIMILVVIVILGVGTALARWILARLHTKKNGRANNAYAVTWHAADNAAERFERIYDRLVAGVSANVSGAELHGAG